MATSLRSIRPSGIRLLGKPKITYVLKHLKIKTATLHRKAERARTRALIRQASYCAGVGRRMIRPAKKGEISQPGKPPRTHNGSKFFKLSVKWGYSRAGRYSVAGPAQVTKRGVPKALHLGGRSYAIRNGKKVPQKVQARPFMDKAFKLTVKKFPGWFRGSVVR